MTDRDYLRDPHLPVAPLVEVWEARWPAGWEDDFWAGNGHESSPQRREGPAAPAQVLGPVLVRNYYRSRARGWILLTFADRIACGLGFHPAELWGDLWWTSAAA